MKRLAKTLLLLSCLATLASCGDSKGKKSCDDDGVCRIGYKINADKPSGEPAKK